jgi:beta-glucanase (GH16 family)
MVDTAKIAGFDKKTVGDTCVSPFTGKKYTLKMIDDFNGTSLDESIWTCEKNQRPGAELQLYMPENVEVRDSNLVLTAKKEDATYERDGKELTSHYTSGKVITRKKFNYQYGRTEIWAKLPKGPGVFPAFWSMGELRGWPWGGEIDIMEIVGGSDQWGNVYRDGQVLASLHWCAPEVEPHDAWVTGKGVNRGPYGEYSLPNRQNGQVFGDEYHLFGAEWTKDKIIAYVDDIKYGERDLTEYSMREAFHQPHFLLLNFALGGSWAGEVDDSLFPIEFDIDWVKVWQEN